jgi:thiol-disulfide isomerase/thioredoxin
LIHFTLYARSYCHLCDDMLHALQAWSKKYAMTIDVVDVDSDEALSTQYDELVPVLFGSKNGAAPIRICHYFLDEQKLEQFFAE